MDLSNRWERRGHRVQALVARAAATAVASVVIVLAGAAYVDGVATLL